MTSSTEKKLQEITIGELRPHNGQISLAEYDPQWPELFNAEYRKIQNALGDRAIRIEHVGSTSVPGLIAKPIIDILLVVVDSADEPAYVPVLEAAGYILRIREPDWHEHRVFQSPESNLHLHVFSKDDDESERMILFRNHLRNNPQDRELYANTKRRLARKHWEYVQDYADAKSKVVEEIISRARSS